MIDDIRTHVTINAMIHIETNVAIAVTLQGLFLV